MTRNFIKAREYIVVFAIAIAMIITGSFVDLGFSKAVYSYTETNLFGVIMSGLAEAPTYLTMSFAGLLLIISCKELPGFKKVISIILGAAAIAFGAVMTFDTFTNIAEFYRTEDYEKLIIAVGIVFDVLMHGLISLYIFKKCLRKNRDNMRMIAIALLSIIVLELLLATILKFVFSRPRPRYLLEGGIGVEQEFRNWWELQPFRCNELADIKSEVLGGIHVSSSNWKSCPSGHTATAIAMMFILPICALLNDDWKNNNKFRIASIYIGLLWGLLTAISRIYAGAHFLSDVGMGLLVGSLSGLLVQLLLPKILKTE